MEYVVVTPAGERLTTAAAIRSLFERGGEATAGKAALLWRLANQSLLGDLLVTLRPAPCALRPAHCALRTAHCALRTALCIMHYAP